MEMLQVFVYTWTSILHACMCKEYVAHFPSQASNSEASFHACIAFVSMKCSYKG